jgi:hypothetical protein
MSEQLFETIIQKTQIAEQLYHRLVLVVAPSGSGKTAALQKVASVQSVPLINVNLELSRRMLDLTTRQRTLQLPQLLDTIVSETGKPLVLLDNLEILFDPSLKQDPLRLLQKLSRMRNIVASWNGTWDNGTLEYASPDHPEYRRYSTRDILIVCPENSVYGR